MIVPGSFFLIYFVPSGIASESSSGSGYDCVVSERSYFHLTFYTLPTVQLLPLPIPEYVSYMKYCQVLLSGAERVADPSPSIKLKYDPVKESVFPRLDICL
jgi:hypothetical protein